MGTARAIFAEVERGRATRIHVTRNHVTESDVSYGQSRDRKRPCPEVCSAHSRVFMATEGWKGVRMRNQKLHNIRPSGAFCPEVRVSRAFFLSTEGWGDFYDVRVLYLVWLLELATRVLYLALFPPFYFHIIYIYTFMLCSIPSISTK
jgi:hypothetical protein